jgi:hypothetical protein
MLRTGCLAPTHARVPNRVPWRVVRRKCASPDRAVLQAIGSGSHTLKDIANASMISTAHLSFYLGQLQELRLVERRIPATLTPAEQRRSRQGR